MKTILIGYKSEDEFKEVSFKVNIELEEEILTEYGSYKYIANIVALAIHTEDVCIDLDKVEAFKYIIVKDNSLDEVLISMYNTSSNELLEEVFDEFKYDIIAKEEVLSIYNKFSKGKTIFPFEKYLIF